MHLQPLGSHYQLYVDGSPGPKSDKGKAGWGIVLMAGANPIYEACGYTEHRISTDAIELEALIQGLAYLVRQDMPCYVTVWTDNMYVAKTVAELPKLHRDGYCNPDGTPIKNQDRIKLIFDLLHVHEATRHCIIRKIKGHDGMFGNELADALSKKAAYHAEAFYKVNKTIIQAPKDEPDQDTTN